MGSEALWLLTENKISGKRSRNMELFRMEQRSLRTNHINSLQAYENHIGNRQPAILFVLPEHEHRV